jgi:CheY-like chemotaxis protein
MRPPTQTDDSPLPGREPPVRRYVLLAQPDIARAARCLEALRPIGLGALVARDADEALAIMRQFGAPVLLLAALSLPGGDGFVVMRALRRQAGPQAAAIIGLTSVIDASRLSPQARRALGVSATLPPTVGPDALRDAIGRALNQIGVVVPSAAGPSAEPQPTPDSIDQTLRDLADEATVLTGVPGVAVYVKAAPHDRFRAHVSWNENDEGLRSPFSLPYVFERVVETGGPLVLADLAAQPVAAAPTRSLQEAVQGLVAAPLIGSTGRVLGAICVFDVRPIDLRGANVDGLQALGRRTGPIIESALRVKPATA